MNEFVVVVFLIADVIVIVIMRPYPFQRNSKDRNMCKLWATCINFVVIFFTCLASAAVTIKVLPFVVRKKGRKR